VKAQTKQITIEFEKVQELLLYFDNSPAMLPSWVKENYEAGRLIFSSSVIILKNNEKVQVGFIDDIILKDIDGILFILTHDEFMKKYNVLSEG